MNAAVECTVLLCTSANFPFSVAALPYNVAFERLSWVVRHHFALEKRFHNRPQLVAPRISAEVFASEQQADLVELGLGEMKFAGKA